ncbi:FecR domain-containing protein [Fulvivirga ulvae]|uniref:FecR family protein n=1 Tax=Fulvivirga ulvae TaxID=2904245 RepID=UPI001F3540F8|nr:FecR family protein [Fulvivirga ulvae]UII29742.1 FecR domain-containing protein [Fulvivirga ulvae]
MIPENALIKFLADEANENDIDQLHQWLSKDTKNHKILTEWMDAYYHQYQNEVEFDVIKGFDRLNHKINEQSPVSTRRKIHDFTYWMKLAAAITIPVLITLIFFLNNPMRSTQVSMVEKSNPYGQKSIIQLSDGTIVKLNAGSSIRYPEKFSPQERKVYLKGEAFFEVTRDTERPFLVMTDDIETKVLGTSFNISAYQQDAAITVSVATGKVSVSHAGDSQVYLEPSEQARFVKKEKQLLKSKINLENTLAWKDNVLLFDGSSFTEVAQKLEMWYGIDVDLKNTGTAKCSITGKFKNENLINVLEAISLSTGINYEKKDDKVTFKGKCK